MFFSQIKKLVHLIKFLRQTDSGFSVGSDLLSDGLPVGQGLGGHQEDARTPDAHQRFQEDKVS